MARAAAALVLLTALALPEPVEAHAQLVRTSPPKRALLRDPPKQIQLWFSERLEPAYAMITVMREGAPVKVGQKTIDVNEKRLSVQLEEPVPGRYTVRFRVLSVDGHVVEDDFTFAVR
jgi:methionine-rich copper-binding protein CopC